MMKKPARTRTSNFSESEEAILLRCILRHVDVVECKRVDAATLKAKQRAWQEIGKEFNLLCPNHARNNKVLKDKYTNVKTMLRKQYAADKANFNASTKNGTEMPEWRPRNEALAEVARVISLSKHGITPPTYEEDDVDYDLDDEDDGSYDTDVKPLMVELTEYAEKPPDSINVHPSIDFQQNDTVDTEQSTSESWSQHKPSVVRKSNKYKCKRPTSTASSSNNSERDDSLKMLKIKLIERQLEMREIEHKTRLSQQRKEHEARMGLLEAQKMDYESKVKLRQLKIAKLTNDKSVKTEVESD